MIEDAPVVASEALTSIADAEMYSIKRTGRGGASMYDPKMPAVTHIHSGKNHAAA
jgi:predicted signal transduction protein with EAL and GGDEF domain